MTPSATKPSANVLPTVLITGATGFVGSHLARRLAGDRWRVHAIVRDGSKLDVLSDAKVQFHQVDADGSQLPAIMAQTKPDVVFHLASLFVTAHAPTDVTPLVQSNILFPMQLLEAMSAAGVRRIVNTGTVWQHYQDARYCPVNLYAATKQALEGLLAYYVDAQEFAAITLKLTDTYGPRDRRRKLFTLLREAAQPNAKPLEMSAGQQLLDLVYIDDVVEAFWLAAHRLLDGKVMEGAQEFYLVCSSAPLRLREVVETYQRVAGVKLPIVWGARPYRAREVMRPWDGGMPIPGWQPKIELHDGIARLLADANKHCGETK